MKWILAVLGAMLLSTVAHAEPRVMTGVFCNAPEDIKTVLENRALDMGAIELVNQDDIKCMLHDGETSAVFVTGLRFVRQDKFGNDTLYMYEATVEGFFIGQIGHKVDALKQYIYLYQPVDPQHKSADL